MQFNNEFHMTLANFELIFVEYFFLNMCIFMELLSEFVQYREYHSILFLI